MYPLSDLPGNPVASGVQWREEKHEACLKWIRYDVKIFVPFTTSSNESNIIDAVKGE